MLQFIFIYFHFRVDILKKACIVPAKLYLLIFLGVNSMTEKYKIVDAKGKHLFNKKVFNSFIDTYNFIDALEVEDLDNVRGLELFAVPTTWENFKGRN